jgi:hypothetical protein
MTEMVLFIAWSNLASAPAVWWIGVNMSVFAQSTQFMTGWPQPAAKPG